MSAVPSCTTLDYAAAVAAGFTRKCKDHFGHASSAVLQTNPVCHNSVSTRTRPNRGSGYVGLLQAVVSTLMCSTAPAAAHAGAATGTLPDETGKLPVDGPDKSMNTYRCLHYVSLAVSWLSVICTFDPVVGAVAPIQVHWYHTSYVVGLWTSCQACFLRCPKS